MFLGFDLSTQQVKCMLINSDFQILEQFGVNFEQELPEYGTKGGSHAHSDGLTVTAPVMMWVEALDKVLEKMQAAGVDFSKIRGICGSGQQHGTVYWKTGSEDKLKNLDGKHTLLNQLHGCFTVEHSPIWQDSSTDAQCKEICQQIGGKDKLLEITGSVAYHRFSGPQIMKFRQNHPELYNDTERIALVSSFGCSIFLGKYAPIDTSDACGMNMLSFRTRKWSNDILDIIGPNLESKLGETVFVGSKIGTISDYFVRRYNFNSDCAIFPWTGDNPASLVGINVADSGIVISLGTSDVVMTSQPRVNPSESGIILCSPMRVDSFMTLSVWKNGSLVREKMRNELGCLTWDEFNELLRRTSAGNDKNIGIYFPSIEIDPVIQGEWRFNNGQEVREFSSAVEARALIEGQCLAKRSRVEQLGFTFNADSNIVLTGGASKNEEIARITADVFQANVHRQNNPDSACYGAACIAATGLGFHRPKGDKPRKGIPSLSVMAKGEKKNAAVYDDLLKSYILIEEKLKLMEK